jgi:uncharacterized phage-associated protein
MRAAMKSVFEVAFWFADTALNENEYLQPQKLQRLLFLAQAYYSVANQGQKLMPAVFVAEEMGPLEPNVYMAFSRSRPDMEVDLFVPSDVEGFLMSIWRRFGHHSPERLTQMAKKTLAYQQAYKKGPRTEIPIEEMRLSFSRAEEAPSIDQVVKPKVMVTQSGKPVTVKSWVPGTKPPPETG